MKIVIECGCSTACKRIPAVACAYHEICCSTACKRIPAVACAYHEMCTGLA